MMSGVLGKSQKWWEKGLQPNMREVTSAQDLVDTLQNAGDKLVIVDFFSPACGGCKALHPKVLFFTLNLFFFMDLILGCARSCDFPFNFKFTNFLFVLWQLCQFAEMNPDVLFLQVNSEDNRAISYSLGVHVLPFFRFYRGAQGRLCSFSCTNATVCKSSLL